MFITNKDPTKLYDVRDDDETGIEKTVFSHRDVDRIFAFAQGSLERGIV